MLLFANLPMKETRTNNLINRVREFRSVCLSLVEVWVAVKRQLRGRKTVLHHAN